MNEIVAILDDDPASRDAMRWLVESVRITARVFSTPQELLGSPDLNDVGCFVLDVRLPAISGVHVLERLRAANIDAPVVFVSGHGRITDAVRAMKLGAFDFLEKPIDGQRLLDSIQEAMTEAKRRQSGGSGGKVETHAETTVALSPREADVAQLLIDGHTNKTAGTALGISVRTVEWHRRNLMHKLNARTPGDLVRRLVTARLEIEPQ